jgi:hypothetical protein
VASRLQALGDEVTGRFFNPNIHPPEESRRREDALLQAAEAGGFPVLPSDSASGLSDFLLALARGGRRRCHTCYRLRLEATGEQAARHGFEAFSTTLLISPYQDVEAIRALGEAAGNRHHVAFRFADLRADYQESCERARSLQLYRQNYCGCLFSALERAAGRASRALGKACPGARPRARAGAAA